jgi:uncharacterized membrane protein (DUF2068 family)
MKRPQALMAIVIYKGFMAALLGITALAIFFSWQNYAELHEFADSLSLAGKRGIIHLIVERIVSFKPGTLKFTAIAASIYAIVTLAEAVGLWYERTWAQWLVIGTVCISIPPEIYELWKEVSLVKAIVFVLNIVILWYLLRDFPKKPTKVESLEE